MTFEDKLKAELPEYEVRTKDAGQSIGYAVYDEGWYATMFYVDKSTLFAASDEVLEGLAKKYADQVKRDFSKARLGK